MPKAVRVGNGLGGLFLSGAADQGENEEEGE